MTTSLHILGTISIITMAFMAVFIFVVGLVAFSRKKSTWSLVASIIIAVWFAASIGLFFLSTIIGCTSALIACLVLLIIFTFRWCGDKQVLPHLAFICVDVIAAILIVLGYFNG